MGSKVRASHREEEVKTSGGEPELTVIIPAIDEAPNLAALLPELHAVLDELDVEREVLIVTNEHDEATLAVGREFDARVLVQQKRGYGGALQAGFEGGRAPHMFTMDADPSPPPAFF